MNGTPLLDTFYNGRCRFYMAKLTENKKLKTALFKLKNEITYYETKLKRSPAQYRHPFA